MTRGFCKLCVLQFNHNYNIKSCAVYSMNQISNNTLSQIIRETNNLSTSNSLNFAINLRKRVHTYSHLLGNPESRILGINFLLNKLCSESCLNYSLIITRVFMIIFTSCIIFLLKLSYYTSSHKINSRVISTFSIDTFIYICRYQRLSETLGKQ